jgi:hypothetical protein
MIILIIAIQILHGRKGSRLGPVEQLERGATVQREVIATVASPLPAERQPIPSVAGLHHSANHPTVPR